MGQVVGLAQRIDLRYGILHEIVFRVLRREPIDHTTPLVNIIWQATSPPPRGSTIRRKPRGFSVRPPSRPTGLRKVARVADTGMITAFAAIRPGVTCCEAIAEGWRRGLTISTAAKTRAEQRELLQTVQADPRPEA